jgi:hypothetical protein
LTKTRSLIYGFDVCREEIFKRVNCVIFNSTMLNLLETLDE